MTLFLHELKQSKISLAIWTLAITFFMVVCVVIYPEMSAEMEQVGDVFASMGSFTAAFGMDQLQLHLQGGIAQKAGKLGLGFDLFRHQVQKQDAQRTDILCQRTCFCHDEDVFIGQHLCRR